MDFLRKIIHDTHNGKMSILLTRSLVYLQKGFRCVDYYEEWRDELKSRDTRSLHPGTSVNRVGPESTGVLLEVDEITWKRVIFFDYRFSSFSSSSSFFSTSSFSTSFSFFSSSASTSSSSSSFPSLISSPVFTSLFFKKFFSQVSSKRKLGCCWTN